MIWNEREFVADTDVLKLRMTKPEKALFVRSLKGVKTYLEYGCGGSTQLAVRAGCRKIVSVESDKTWIGKVAQADGMAEAIADRRLILHHVDIGPVGAWGRPADDSRVRNWPRYVVDPHLKYNFSYDMIFVDGRFRQACACAAYAYMFDNAKLAVHDYTTRAKYSDIEKFFDLEEISQTLAIFRKKEKVVQSTLYNCVLTSLFDL